MHANKSIDIGNCRGLEKKKAIIEKYKVTPLLHSKLLNGQERGGCCGKIADRYYCFSAESVASKEETTFLVGYSCADDFLKMLNAEPLPCFNPLRPQSSQFSEGETSSLNIEVVQAISFLCMAWNGIPVGVLKKTVAFINRNPDKDTKLFSISALNNIIKKDKRGRLLQEMIADIRQRNPNLKHYRFPLINQLLKHQGEKNYIG